jgi:hypothetical protein
VLQGVHRRWPNFMKILDEPNIGVRKLSSSTRPFAGGCDAPKDDDEVWKTGFDTRLAENRCTTTLRDDEREIFEKCSDELRLRTPSLAAKNSP